MEEQEKNNKENSTSSKSLEPGSGHGFSQDMSQEEADVLANFLKTGRQGISKLNDTKAFGWFQLYMSGHSYKEIANNTGDSLELILYLANVSKWHDKKIEYYAEIYSKTTNKVASAKVEALNTISNISNAMSKYFNKKFVNYLQSNNENFIEDLDTKLLEKYYKTVEMLDKLTPSTDKKSSTSPSTSVNINLESGSGNVQQLEDGSIEITTNTTGEILKQLSNLRRQMEK